jgi:hypothetical protein
MRIAKCATAPKRGTPIFFPLRSSGFSIEGFTISRERREIRDGHYIAPAADARYHRRTRHAGHGYCPRKHRLDDQGRGAHENEIDIEILLAEEPGIFGDHPRQAAVVDHGVWEENFLRLLSETVGYADHQKNNACEQKSFSVRSELWCPTKPW